MEKKLTSVLKFILLMLMFAFGTIYVSNIKGYYSFSNYKKSLLTEEGIRKFEQDVADGVAIDIDDYIEDDIDYSNKISRTSLYISNRIGGFIRGGIVKFFDSITSNIE